MTDLKNLKLLLFDCDGTLTDGRMIYDSEGNTSKNFCAPDGFGFMLLRFTNLVPCIITGSYSLAITQRFGDLKISEVHQKVDNKLACAQKLMQKYSATWEQVAYIGDDYNDWPVMRKAGFAVAVANAPKPLQERVHWVTTKAGGYGAVREFIEHILKSRDEYEQILQKYLDFAEQA